MRGRQFMLLAGTGLASFLFAAGAPAGAAGPASLTGKVSSAEEGAMEGVLVTAQKDGSTIAYTVTTNDKGEYAFPAAKIDPGHYTLKIRAIGYQGSGTADVAAGTPASADLALTRVKNIAGQMSNAEWLASFPGSDTDKQGMLGCTNCHTLQRIVQSTYDGDQFLEVMGRMARYSNNSFPLRQQLRVAETDATTRFGAGATKTAHYMASINLSEGPSWSYPLKTNPRVTGKATQAVITEYTLPRQSMMPHDVITDANGLVWFSDFGTNVLGSLDAKTGKVTEHPYPTLREGFPEGALNVEPDPDGNLWLALMFQSGVAKYDVKADTFTMFPVPEKMRTNATQQPMLSPTHWTVDSKIWMADNATRGVHRLDLKTGMWESIDPFALLPKNETHTVYGIYADKQNNLFFEDFGGESVGRIDAKTGEIKMVATPTKNSKPRRGRLDDQDRLWFAEFYGNKAGVYDFTTSEVKEWAVPTAWSAPYDATADRTGMLWAAGMEADRIVRIDPKTGETVEYPLPHQTNIRRIFVDNRTDPVTFWVGNNDSATIIKLEVPQ
jgi:virginiamycin B lyase